MNNGERFLERLHLSNPLDDPQELQVHRLQVIPRVLISSDTLVIHARVWILPAHIPVVPPVSLLLVPVPGLTGRLNLI